MDNETTEQSISWAKASANWKPLVAQLTNGKNIPRNPVSVFMAGSPGAGKTEVSKNFIESMANVGDHIVRIDPDELRMKIPHYVAGRSELMNSATSILVEKAHDKILSGGYHFLLDGTLTNFDKAKSNIERSLHRGRKVSIFYIFLDPIQAWEFTQKRELVEGRNIPKEAFIQQFFRANNVVSRLKDEFGDRISIMIIDRNTGQWHEAQNSKTIDNYIANKYTIDTLMQML